MKMNSKNIVIISFIIFGLYIFVSAYINVKKREDSIEQNKFETIALVYKFESNKSNNRYYYKYFYNNKKYLNDENLSGFNRENCIGKFYKIHLSTENPQYSKILLEQKVSDTTEILNSGFKLIKKKKSKYNSSTNEYSEFNIVEFE